MSESRSVEDAAAWIEAWKKDNRLPQHSVMSSALWKMRDFMWSEGYADQHEAMRVADEVLYGLDSPVEADIRAEEYREMANDALANLAEAQRKIADLKLQLDIQGDGGGV